MAADAGHAFARHLTAFPQRHGAVLTLRGTYAHVAADAERSHGRCEFVDLLFELVEHRGYAGVGVVGTAPLVVDLRVTGLALAGAGVLVLFHHLGVRVCAGCFGCRPARLALRAGVAGVRHDQTDKQTQAVRKHVAQDHARSRSCLIEGGHFGALPFCLKPRLKRCGR